MVELTTTIVGLSVSVRSVNFWKCDGRTTVELITASVGLTQACPIYTDKSLLRLASYVCTNIAT